MKVFLKKKKANDESGLSKFASYILDPKEIARSKAARQQQERNAETQARVAQVLASVNSKNYTVLAKADSDSSGDGYEIRMGSNHAVFCSCKGWQYSKNGTCKHLERFKVQVKPFRVKASRR